MYFFFRFGPRDILWSSVLAVEGTNRKIKLVRKRTLTESRPNRSLSHNKILTGEKQLKTRTRVSRQGFWNILRKLFLGQRQNPSARIFPFGASAYRYESAKSLSQPSRAAKAGDRLKKWSRRAEPQVHQILLHLAMVKLPFSLPY